MFVDVIGCSSSMNISQIPSNHIFNLRAQLLAFSGIILCQKPWLAHIVPHTIREKNDNIRLGVFSNMTACRWLKVIQSSSKGRARRASDEEPFSFSVDRWATVLTWDGQESHIKRFVASKDSSSVVFNHSSMSWGSRSRTSGKKSFSKSVYGRLSAMVYIYVANSFNFVVAWLAAAKDRTDWVNSQNQGPWCLESIGFAIYRIAAVAARRVNMSFRVSYSAC